MELLLSQIPPLLFLHRDCSVGSVASEPWDQDCGIGIVRSGLWRRNRGIVNTLETIVDPKLSRGLNAKHCGFFFLYQVDPILQNARDFGGILSVSKFQLFDRF